MDYSGTLALLGQEEERQRLRHTLEGCKKQLDQILQQMYATCESLHQLPGPPKPEELKTAQEQLDLVFHQLLVDLNQALLDLKDNDEIWIRDQGTTFVLATVTRIEHTSGGGTLHYQTKKCAGNKGFLNYYEPLYFYNLLCLPLKVGTFTPDQTRALYENVAKITEQRTPLFI